jgi:Leucine-rich repeat (LRR) protein
MTEGLKKRARFDEGREAAAHRQRQIGRFGGLEVLPRDILVLLLTYLAPNDILNVRQVSRALNQLVMGHPDQLPAILVRLTIEQMHEVPEDFRPWIRNLTITDNYRVSVEQLEYLVRAFPRLRELYLRRYQCDDIEPLGGLRNLRTLNLNFYHGDNIEPLRDLVNLQKLALNCYRGDLGPLCPQRGPTGGLVNLQELDLASYRGDLGALRGLVNLQKLLLDCYHGDDIEPLHGLVNLQRLDLNCYRGDIEPLRDLVKLQRLDLWNHPDQEAVRALGIN